MLDVRPWNVSNARMKARPWHLLVPLATMVWVVTCPSGAVGQQVVVRVDLPPPAEAVLKLISSDERAERGAIRVITMAFMHDVEEGSVLKVGN